jgi:hypothetical protein
MRQIALALIAAVAWPAIAIGQDVKSSPLPSHLPLRTEACFGRTYDADHLKRHPKQRVIGFHLFRDFTVDPGSEQVWATRKQMLSGDGENGVAMTSAYVRFRDKRGLFYATLGCLRTENIVRCGIDCDGGGFRLRTSGKSLLLDNEGFVVTGGCGPSQGLDEETDFVKPGADDRVFRLDPKPVAECAAIRDSLKPSWAKLGAPLRVRLNRAEAVCFARSYDAAHLVRHPKQTVRRIAVLKPTGGLPLHGNDVYRLNFRIEFSDGRKLAKTTTCQPNKYAYGCTHDPQMDAQDDFYLTRAGESDLMLRDRKGKLADLFGEKLGSDDRLFKLSASPESACQF